MCVLCSTMNAEVWVAYGCSYCLRISTIRCCARCLGEKIREHFASGIPCTQCLSQMHEWLGLDDSGVHTGSWAWSG